MNSRTTRTVVAGLLALSAANPLNAHHGLAMYDTSRVVELKGKVVGFELMDPHSLLYVDVENADGSTTPWVIEGGTAHGIIGSGVTREMLASGPMVVVRAYRSADKRCLPRCRANGQDFSFEFGTNS